MHPFADGRIARAIADMTLARSDQSAQRFYSMSAQIRIERDSYYDRLEKTQAGGLEITPWLEWFLGCLDRAIVLRKARFWEIHAHKPFNDRQRLMLNQLLDGFAGKMTFVEMGAARQVLAAHGAARHPRPHRTRSSRQRLRRRAQHQLFVSGAGLDEDPSLNKD